MVSCEGAGETASSTRDQGRALSTEDEASALEIFDSTDAVQFWHDEGVPDSLASAVEDVRKFRVCGDQKILGDPPLRTS